MPTSGPVEASASISEYLSPAQKRNHQSRMRGPDTSIEAGVKRPLHRSYLIQEKLEAVENIGSNQKSLLGKNLLDNQYP